MPNVDTIIAIKEVVNSFNAQFAPWAVNNYLSLTQNSSESNILGTQLTIILVSNYVSLIAITYLIFCPWKKGP